MARQSVFHTENEGSNPSIRKKNAWWCNSVNIIASWAIDSCSNRDRAQKGILNIIYIYIRIYKKEIELLLNG